MPRIQWRDPRIRNSHTWITAPTNQGKSVLIKTCLAFDFKAVQQGRARIFIMEGEGQILNAVNSRAMFDRVPLTLVDPRDRGLSINPFDVPKTNRGRDTSVIEMLEYVFNSILDAPMTEKQEPFFSAVVQTMLLVEKPSLAKMLAILEDRHTIDPQYLNPRLKFFWENTFKADKTREQLAWRMRKVFERSRVMANIFSSDRNDVDYRQQVNEPGVTIIHPNRGLLRKYGSKFFGRLALMQIWNAIETTRDPDDPNNLQCFIYIDEAHDYISDDPNVEEMLDKMRKYKVGLIMAHQRIKQLSPNVLDALYEDAGTILASGVRDARLLASAMSCSPQDIQSCQTGEFMLYIKGQYDKAVRVKIPGYDLEYMPSRAVPLRETYKPPKDPEQDEDGPIGEPPSTAMSPVAPPPPPAPPPQPDYGPAIVSMADAIANLAKSVQRIDERQQRMDERLDDRIRQTVREEMASYNLNPAPVVDQSTALTVRTRDAEFTTEGVSERAPRPTRRGKRRRKSNSEEEYSSEP